MADQTAQFLQAPDLPPLSINDEELSDVVPLINSTRRANTDAQISKHSNSPVPRSETEGGVGGSSAWALILSSSHTQS